MARTTSKRLDGGTLLHRLRGLPNSLLQGIKTATPYFVMSQHRLVAILTHGVARQAELPCRPLHAPAQASQRPDLLHNIHSVHRHLAANDLARAIFARAG